MTLPAESPASAMPVATPALEPAWVRHGSSAVQKSYAAALEFEQLLLTQMASALTKGGELGGEGGEEGGSEGEAGSGGEPGGSVYSSMLPQALASGVVSGGGLGLAAEIARQLPPGAGANSPTAALGSATATVAPNAAGAVEAPAAGTAAR